MKTISVSEKDTVDAPVVKSQPLSEWTKMLIALSINTVILFVGVFALVQASESDLRAEIRSEVQSLRMEMQSIRTEVQSLERKIDNINNRLDDLFFYLFENRNRPE